MNLCANAISNMPVNPCQVTRPTSDLQSSSGARFVHFETSREMDDTGKAAIDSKPEAVNPGLLATTDSSLSRRDSVGSTGDSKTPNSMSPPISPNFLGRSASFSTNGYENDTEDFDYIPPLERLTVFDFLENLALPQRLEKLQTSIAAQTERVRRQQQKFKSSSKFAKDRVVDEWRRRLPTPDEQLDRYKKRMRSSVERLGRKWSDSKSVTAREKISFIAGVLNIFISGYLVGAFPDWFHVWYTAQLLYYIPLRFYTYRKKGYHYFLADLCYFVNFLLLLSIWVFPRSKRLFISTFCLAFGNNAVAIAMWRNSLVFHSMDKVVSLFIHIMPCVTIHCMVHLVPADFRAWRFPAIHNIKTSEPSSPDHYSLGAMVVWATVPYAVWQLTYHFMITVRKREKIAAGRPTSFTYLRKSYAPTWIGKLVLSLPDALQEPAFMFIQYSYALITMSPCPLWFWSRWASAAFLGAIFTWSVYNGATYYIDIFGTKFQKELEQLKGDVARWQLSPDMPAKSPLQTPRAEIVDLQPLSLGASATNGDAPKISHARNTSLDQIPLLDGRIAASTGLEQDGNDLMRERNRN